MNKTVSIIEGFSPPDITEEDIAEVVATLRSGWITTGPKVKEFEQQIAAYCGTSVAVCLNSQTSCAEMTLRVLGIGPGDEVILPAYTYTATASAVIHVGAKPVMIDCQPDCLEMDYEQVDKAITDRTKVIIPVDLAGIVCDYERILKLVEAKRYLFKAAENTIQKAFNRIVILADGAHSFGGIRNNRKSGSIADFTCFSFHAVKNITTAEGGAVTWRDIRGIDSENIYRQFELLSLHGQSKDALTKDKLGNWEYDIIAPYYKCNMTDIHAALGVSQLRRYNRILNRRREIIEKYDSALKPLGIKPLCHYGINHSSSGHLYIMQLPESLAGKRDAFIDIMMQKGVPCNVHYKPLPMMTAYKECGFNISDFANAMNFYEREVTLPLFTKLSDSQVDFIISVVKESLQSIL